MQLWTHWNLKDSTSTAASLALGQLLVVTQYNSTDRVTLKVKSQSKDIALKFNHLAVLHFGKTVNTDDAVRYRDDGAFVCSLRCHIKLRYTLLNDVADF